MLMKVVLVEDDGLQAKEIQDALRRQYKAVEIERIESEQAFRLRMKNWKSNPPAMFIIDVMLPWMRPGDEKIMNPPKGATYREAGLRCVKLALKEPLTSGVPIIIHSVIAADDVRRKLGKIGHLPSNILIVTKDGMAEKLGLTLRSVTMASAPAQSDTGGKDIFIVHGHDDEAKETVARFVEKLGGKAIILHEQPNGGRTIIEKFEHHANVAFAIVLLTPDDLGGKSAKALKQRARQNVVFELGFFFAKLGRNRVCALHKEDVEIPSDIQGVIYTPMDKAGAWRTALARELKEAGVPLDYDKVI